MKKILLITINKDSTPEELKQVERCISVETANIEEIPSINKSFKPTTKVGNSAVYICLKSEENKPNTSCEKVDNHDAIVYARFIKS